MGTGERGQWWSGAGIQPSPGQLRSQPRPDRTPSRRPRTIVRPCDIASASERLTLVEDIAGRGIIVDTLINNAGFGAAGRIAETDPVRQTSQVEVNCEAVVHLCGLLLPGMIAAKQGSIINVASTAAFQPIPQFATYAASKSFVLSFTKALWAETNGTGVRVTAVCPAPPDGSWNASSARRCGAYCLRRSGPSSSLRHRRIHQPRRRTVGSTPATASGDD